MKKKLKLDLGKCYNKKPLRSEEFSSNIELLSCLVNMVVTASFRLYVVLISSLKIVHLTQTYIYIYIYFALRTFIFYFF